MNNPTPTKNSTTRSSGSAQTSPTPWRCLIGAVISGGLAIALYSLTTAIAHTFASKPIHSDNPAVINIASAVRTLVVGITALGAGIFGVVAIGLVALAIQLLVQKITKRSAPPSDVQ
jgi:hypothetical protein